MSARVREVRTVGPIAMLTIVLAACSSGSAATTAPTTGASPTGSVSPPSVTPSPIQTVELSPSLAVLPTGARVPRGAYATLFDPAMTLTLDLPAESNEDLSGWVDFTFEGDPPFSMHILRVDKVEDTKHPANLVDPPDDLVGWLSRHPGLTLLAPAKAVKVGGLDATQLDVRTGDKDVFFGPFPGVDNPSHSPDLGYFAIGRRQPARLIVVDFGGRHVVLSMNLETQGMAHFEEDMQALQPLVDSIVWH